MTRYHQNFQTVGCLISDTTIAAAATHTIQSCRAFNTISDFPDKTRLVIVAA